LTNQCAFAGHSLTNETNILKNTDNQPRFLDSPTFASTLGQAVFLMTVSKRHRDLKISVIEEIVSTAIFLQQFKLYSKGKQPIAFLAWATVSDEVKERFDAGNVALELKDWRSGSNLIVVDCISPFTSEKEIKKQFFTVVKGGNSNAK